MTITTNMTAHVRINVGETTGIELHADAQHNVWVRWAHPSDEEPAKWRATPYTLGPWWNDVVDFVAADFLGEGESLDQVSVSWSYVADGDAADEYRVYADAATGHARVVGPVATSDPYADYGAPHDTFFKACASYEEAEAYANALFGGPATKVTK